MKFNEYQAAAVATSVEHKNVDERLTNACLGLAGESGEFCDLVKKAFYHGKDIPREHLIKELGDIMWYIALAADALQVPMEEIAEINIKKLRARYPEGHFSKERANNRAEGDI